MGENIKNSDNHILNQVWYVRHKNKITGPFPGRLISRRILLGQVFLNDELSLDQSQWQPVSELVALIPDVMREDLNDSTNQERALLSKRWADERVARSRRKKSAYGVDEKIERQPATDRRDLESLREIGYREKRDQRLEDARKTRKQLHKQYERRQRIQGITITLLIIGFVLALFFYAPSVPDLNEKIDCTVAPQPDVVWSNCQLAGISYPASNLSGAHIRNANLSRANLSESLFLKTDLSYSNLSYVNLRGANLSQANLKGANLQKANLKKANLSNADLSYADLTGAKLGAANFTNTLLSKTIWVNGKECEVGSIGTCNTRSQ